MAAGDKEPPRRRAAPASSRKRQPTDRGSSYSRLYRTVRDAAIVATGIFLLVNEATGSDPAQPALIAAALGCFGLPFVLRAEERRGDK